MSTFEQRPTFSSQRLPSTKRPSYTSPSAVVNFPEIPLLAQHLQLQIEHDDMHCIIRQYLAICVRPTKKNTAKSMNRERLRISKPMHNMGYSISLNHNLRSQKKTPKEKGRKVSCAGGQGTVLSQSQSEGCPVCGKKFKYVQLPGTMFRWGDWVRIKDELPGTSTP